MVTMSKAFTNFREVQMTHSVFTFSVRIFPAALANLAILGNSDRFVIV